MAGGAQQADEGVTQDGVAKVTDVRGLVGIDRGVLDQNLAADIGGAFADVAEGYDGTIGDQPLRRNVALEVGIDITGAGNFEFLESVGQRQLGHDLFGDLSRRFAQFFCQFKG